MREFWVNKVEVFSAKNLEELKAKLNEFYKDRFIIATQVFPAINEWHAIVYYKINPKEVKDGEKRKA